MNTASDETRHSHARNRALGAWGTRRLRALRIGVFDKRDSEHRIQSIQDTAVERPLYSMGDGTAYPGDILDTRLADVEGLVLPILARWCEGPTRDLRNHEQLVALSAYLAVVHAQPPSSSVRLREFDTALREDRSEFGEGPLSGSDSDRVDVDDGEMSRIDEIRRVLDENAIRIGMNPNEAARLSLHVPEVAFGALRAMRWHLIEAPDGSEFITSDAPLNVFVPDEPRLAPAENLMSPNAEVTFPLSPRTCLFGRRARTPRGRSRPPRVSEVNERQARGAERFVFFREWTEAVEKAVRKGPRRAEPCATPPPRRG